MELKEKLKVQFDQEMVEMKEKEAEVVREASCSRPLLPKLSLGLGDGHIYCYQCYSFAIATHTIVFQVILQ